MNNFYFTFMTKQAFKNKYVKITAPNDDMARECMEAHFSDKWAFDYTEDRFLPQIDQFNLMPLCEIVVIDYGHGSVEYKQVS